MYENGGNVTHRLFDGHPQMFVYPFESQLGTKLVVDHLSSMFPVKYRWPVFALDATPLQDYKSIIDEECKVRARTPHVSKFRHIPFDFSDDDRCDRYCTYADETGRSRAHNVTNFSEPPLILGEITDARGRKLVTLVTARLLSLMPTRFFRISLAHICYMLCGIRGQLMPTQRNAPSPCLLRITCLAGR